MNYSMAQTDTMTLFKINLTSQQCARHDRFSGIAGRHLPLKTFTFPVSECVNTNKPGGVKFPGRIRYSD